MISSPSTSSDTTMTASTDSAKPKRKYSKNGCRECKRRKMKCDETKPFCWQCSRLNKSCMYDAIKETKASLKQKKRRLSATVREMQHQQPPQASQQPPQLYSNLFGNNSRSNILPISTPPPPSMYSQYHDHPPSHVATSSAGSLLPSPQPAALVGSFHHPSVTLLGQPHLHGYQQPPPLQQPMRNYPNSSTLAPRNSISSILNGSSTSESVDTNTKNSQYDVAPPLQQQQQQQQQVTGAPLLSNTHYISSNYSAAGSSPTVPTQLQQQHHSPYYQYSPKQQQKSRGNSIALLINHDSQQQVSKPSNTPSPSSVSTPSALQNSSKLTNGSHSQSPLVQCSSSQTANSLLSDTPVERKDSYKEPKIDLNSLVVDLDSLVNNGLFKFNVGAGSGTSTINSNNASNVSSVGSPTSSPTYHNNVNLQLSQHNTNTGCYNFKINANQKQSHHIRLSDIEIDEPQRKYIDHFYHDFCKVILPFEPATDVNPIRDMLLHEATQHDYLLLAILASGAKSSYEYTGSSQDSAACDEFLTNCYQSSVRAFGDNKFVDANIESVLFTVLLLTTYNATSHSQSWRTHLNGAKDLLKKYAFSDSKKRITRGLTISVYWFIIFEMLVGLLNPYGGTLTTDDELDLFFSFNSDTLSIMKDLGLVSNDKDYNLMYCFHNDFVSTLKDMIKLLNRVKNVTTDFYSINSSKDSSWFNKVNVSADEIFDLMAELSKERKYEVISRDGKVPVLHKRHFRNYNYGSEISAISEKNRLIISEDVKGMVFFMNPKKANSVNNLEVYSWYDISHQSFVIGSMIALSTIFLGVPKESRIVQELVNKLLNDMYFFFDYLVENDTGFVINSEVVRSSGIKYYFMLIQWPMLMTGFNCVDEPSQGKIVNFFKLLSKVGVGSAGHSLKKLRICWTKNKTSNEKLKDKISTIVENENNNGSEGSNSQINNEMSANESEDDIVPY